MSYFSSRSSTSSPILSCFETILVVFNISRYDLEIIATNFSLSRGLRIMSYAFSRVSTILESTFCFLPSWNSKEKLPLVSIALRNCVTIFLPADAWSAAFAFGSSTSAGSTPRFPIALIASRFALDDSSRSSFSPYVSHGVLPQPQFISSFCLLRTAATCL